MPPSRAEEILRRCELEVRARVEGLRRGDHLANVAGEGLEARDVREYEPGDDVRQMAWSVTARTAIPHVKTFEAEHEMTVWALVDVSSSMLWGTAAWDKSDLSMNFVAALSILVARRGNRLGGAALQGGRAELFPPVSGRSAGLSLLTKIERTLRPGQPPSPGRLGQSLAAASRALRKRGLVVVISDFLDPRFEKPLGDIGIRNEVIAARITDPRETSLPNTGVVVLEDPETGRQLEVDTTDQSLRNRFRINAETQSRQIERAVRRTGAGYLELSTGRDWVEDLLAFLDEYPRRR